MKLPNMKQYAVAQYDPDEGSFWGIYDTIEDAVSNNDDECNVFVGEFKKLGKFRMKAEAVLVTKKAKIKK